MTDDTFPCPSCRSLLRRSAQTTPGTHVKCPRCANVFQVPEEEIPLAPQMPEAIADRPIPPPERPRESDWDRDRDREPRPPLRRNFDEDEDYRDRDRDRRQGRRRGERSRHDLNLTSDYRSDIGKWFGLASRNWADYLGPFIGYAFLAFFICLVCYMIMVFVTLITLGLGLIVAIPVFLLIIAALTSGPYAAAIRAIQGRDWSFNDMFAGFEHFGPVALYSFLIAVIQVLLYSPAFVILFVALLQGPGRFPDELAILLGVYFYLIGPILITILQVKMFFALGLILEMRMSATEAMAASWRMTNNHFWVLFGFQIILALLVFSGVLACLIGVLFAAPLAILAHAGAYVHVTDQPANRDGRRDRVDMDGDDDDDDGPRSRPQPRDRDDDRSPRYRSRPDEDY